MLIGGLAPTRCVLRRERGREADVIARGDVGGYVRATCHDTRPKTMQHAMRVSSLPVVFSI